MAHCLFLMHLRQHPLHMPHISLGATVSNPAIMAEHLQEAVHAKGLWPVTPMLITKGLHLCASLG